MTYVTILGRNPAFTHLHLRGNLKQIESSEHQQRIMPAHGGDIHVACSSRVLKRTCRIVHAGAMQFKTL